MFNKSLVLSQWQWKKLPLKTKKNIWEKSKNEAIVFVSPNMTNHEKNLSVFDPESVFLWSFDFIFYIYCFFQSKIIFNARLVSVCPFRRFKISRKINEVILNIQKNLIPWDKISHKISQPIS